jgi:hypothetical protein
MALPQRGTRDICAALRARVVSDASLKLLNLELAELINYDAE